MTENTRYRVIFHRPGVRYEMLRGDRLDRLRARAQRKLDDTRYGLTPHKAMIERTDSPIGARSRPRWELIETLTPAGDA